MKKNKITSLLLAVLIVLMNSFSVQANLRLPTRTYPLSHQESQAIGPGEKKQESQESPDGVTTGQGIQIDFQLLEKIQEESATFSVDAEHDYIIVLGAVTEDDYQRFLTSLHQVDSRIINRFKAEQWNILLTNADLDQLLMGGTTYGVKGYIAFNHRTIYINSGEYSYCIIHEMGHFLDYCSDFASLKAEFQTIFAVESPNLSRYGQTHPVEFFAEIYMYWTLYKDEVQAACPAALEYLKHYLNQLN